MNSKRLAAVCLFALGLLAGAAPAWAEGARPIEVHDRLALADAGSADAVAITLDACGGEFDRALVDTLIAERVPATVFVTQRWLARNPAGVAVLLAHPDLFDLQDHGTAHVPAIIGAGRRIYGLAGEPDLAHLQAEVAGAARTIERLTGHAPSYYRGATAQYDAQALQTIDAMGYRVAGFSVNADAGATLPRAAIVARLRAVRPGDVVIAHVNKPAGFTAEAFAEVLPVLKARGLRFVTLSQARLQRI
ncbi:MAG: polysaccharide deacetylase family protein [Burkholderiaceae bacterium]